MRALRVDEETVVMAVAGPSLRTALRRARTFRQLRHAFLLTLVGIAAVDLVMVAARDPSWPPHLMAMALTAATCVGAVVLCGRKEQSLSERVHAWTAMVRDIGRNAFDARLKHRRQASSPP